MLKAATPTDGASTLLARIYFSDVLLHSDGPTLIFGTNQRWALEVFLNFFKNEKWFFFAFLKKLLTCSALVLFKKPTPSQINLIKNAKKHFLWLKKFKNTSSAHLWLVHKWTAERRLSWIAPFEAAPFPQAASRYTFNIWRLLQENIQTVRSLGPRHFQSWAFSTFT